MVAAHLSTNQQQRHLQSSIQPASRAYVTTPPVCPDHITLTHAPNQPRPKSAGHFPNCRPLLLVAPSRDLEARQLSLVLGGHAPRLQLMKLPGLDLFMVGGLGWVGWGRVRGWVDLKRECSWQYQPRSACFAALLPAALEEHSTAQHTAHSTQHTAHSTQHTAHSTQHTAHSTRHTAHSTQHTAHGAHLFQPRLLPGLRLPQPPPLLQVGGALPRLGLQRGLDLGGRWGCGVGGRGVFRVAIGSVGGKNGKKSDQRQEYSRHS